MKHLSSEQISQWLAGERNAEMEQHARECSACQSEIARIEAALSMFRSSVRTWSEQWGRGMPCRQSRPVRPLRWALIAAALVMLVAAPIYQSVTEKQRRAETANADALLLQQVDTEVSRAVPRTMEPLMRLVAWDAKANDGKESERIQ